MATNTLKSGDVLPDNIRVYKNGALYDKERGRIVGYKPELAEYSTLITSANSAEMLSKRLDNKRATIAAAALAAVQSTSLVKAHGSAAWIAEIAQAQMAIATTPDAGVASTKAADWLVNNAGLGERQAVENSGLGAASAGVASLVAELAAFASSVAGLVSSGREAADSTASVYLTNIISNDERTQNKGEGDEVGGG